MSEDTFSSKEILVRVMAQVESIHTSMAAQQLLLQKHIDASVSRDELIRQIKIDVEKIEVRVGMLENFKIKLAGIWVVVSFIGYFVADFLYRKFFG